MTERQPLDLNMTVADLLKTWPQAIPVFIRHRMSCVGCSMSSFETLREAGLNYGISPETFLGELADVISLYPYYHH